jgi:hypothetical protein
LASIARFCSSMATRSPRRDRVPDAGRFEKSRARALGQRNAWALQSVGEGGRRQQAFDALEDAFDAKQQWRDRARGHVSRRPEGDAPCGADLRGGRFI